MPGLSTSAVTSAQGSLAPQGRRFVYHFDPTHGFTGDYDFNGADQTLMQALYSDYIASGCTATITLENDKASLVVKDSTQEYVIDSWEIVSNNEVRDLFSHPAFVSYVQTVGETEGETLGSVAADLRQGLANNTDPATLFAVDAPLGIFNGTIVEDFYTQYQLGNTGYRSAQYVLRHKTNVSNRWGVNISDYGIDLIYTPAEFLAEVSDSGLWAFPLPGRLQYKLALIPAPDPQTGYLWGWLKYPSTETTAANNRVDITTEYNLDLWFIEEYGLY